MFCSGANGDTGLLVLHLASRLALASGSAFAEPNVLLRKKQRAAVSFTQDFRGHARVSVRLDARIWIGARFGGLGIGSIG